MVFVLNRLGGILLVIIFLVMMVVEFFVFVVYKFCDRIEYDVIWDKKYIWLIVLDFGWVLFSRNKYLYYFEYVGMCFWRGSFIYLIGNLIDLLVKYINYVN